MSLWRSAVVLALAAAPATAAERGAARPTVEVEESARGGRVRLVYTVRNISAGLDEPTVLLGIADTAPQDAVPQVPMPTSENSVITLVVGVARDSDTASLRTAPLEVESPRGWRAHVIANGQGPERRWRVSWTCADSGWEEEVTHRIRPGATLSGFAVELAAPDPTYTGGLYRASIDHEAHVVGRVFLAKAPARR